MPHSFDTIVSAKARSTVCLGPSAPVKGDVERRRGLLNRQADLIAHGQVIGIVAKPAHRREHHIFRDIHQLLARIKRSRVWSIKVTECPSMVQVQTLWSVGLTALRRSRLRRADLGVARAALRASMATAATLHMSSFMGIGLDVVRTSAWLVAAFRRVNGYGPLKAGFEPPPRCLNGQVLVAGLIDRRRNQIASSLDHLRR
jgi:hypothetical protein